ncbi:hypothetical protein FH972_024108 [Carpinus fangiana]|uniref:F-box domain-containing protein n=1 Tax=Carpinus fangiana TaxID=176857 RepID=A0A5N6KXF4_9ROSI|nr:hypothetical protein FH972_024108 [Carpinus fangiana]
MTFDKPRLFDSERAPFQAHPDPKVRLLAYYPNWINSTVICPPKKAPLQSEYVRPVLSSALPSNISSALPVEVLHLVLAFLSLEDLVSLRQTQQFFNIHILAFPPYRHLYDNVPEVLHALFATRLAHVHLVEKIFHAARADRCCKCNRLGAFVFLFTLERCCFACLRDADHFRLIPINAAKDIFSLPSRITKALPTLSVYCGTYGLKERKIWRRSKQLLSARQVIQATALYHGSSEHLVKAQARNACASQCEHGPRQRSAKQWARALNFEIGGDPFSGVAAISLPFLRQNQTVETPMWCAGCEICFVKGLLHPADHDGRGMAYDLDKRAYTVAGLLAHSLECPGARRIWDESEAAPSGGVLEEQYLSI